MHSFHPLFNNIRENLKEIWKKNKEYGFHLYLGQIADQSTYQLDRIFITYFVNTTQLGFYSLAMTITAPMVGLSQALSMSLFKGFVDMKRIPKKVIYYNFLWLAACVAGLVIFGKFIVVLLFTENFLPTVPLILPLALAGLVSGLTLPHNNLLSAHTRGTELRNTSFIMSISNLMGNILLVPAYGAMGAAWVSFISCAVCSITRWSYYRRYIQQREVKE